MCCQQTEAEIIKIPFQVGKHQKNETKKPKSIEIRNLFVFFLSLAAFQKRKRSNISLSMRNNWEMGALRHANLYKSKQIVFIYYTNLVGFGLV